MNPIEMLKNLKNIQSSVADMQEKMKDVIITGTSGGDMVKIEINGQMDVRNVTISPEAVDTEDITMLEDLILAAFTDASVKMKNKMRDEMSSITGGMDIPPGLMGM